MDMDETTDHPNIVPQDTYDAVDRGVPPLTDKAHRDYSKKPSSEEDHADHAEEKACDEIGFEQDDIELEQDETPGDDEDQLNQTDLPFTEFERISQHDRNGLIETAPSFPFVRCRENTAIADFQYLKKHSFIGLVEKGEWQSRSEIDDEYLSEYVVKRNPIGLRSSDFHHWQARMACEADRFSSPVRTWFDAKIRKSLETSGFWETSKRSAVSMRQYVASQFRPSAAKALYELFGAKRIYDPCGGWGDRLTAAMASDLELYYCRDVNPLVFAGYALQQQYYPTDVEISYEFKGSEIDCPAENFFDLVFTSPPYYKIERYQTSGSKQAKQSHAKFDTFDAWLNGYLFQMIDHAWRSLKDNGYLAINISDCYADGTSNKIVMPMLEYVLNKFTDAHFVAIIGYAMASRVNVNNVDISGEPITIFRKGAYMNFEDLIPEKKQMCFGFDDDYE